MKTEPTKELLHEMYVAKQLNVKQIASEIDSCYSTVLRRLKAAGIPIRTVSEALKGKVRTEEQRRRISDGKKGSKPPRPHGRRCWYTCPDGKTVSVRSRWEVWYAEYLRENGVEFQYEPTTFMLPDGCAYTPDFFLVVSKEYVEVKGWLTDKDREKMSKFREAYPQHQLVLADQKYLQGLGIDLRKKWVSEKPKFPCEKCGELYHRSYPQQMFCSITCRNSNNPSKCKMPPQEKKKEKRRYNGSQAGEKNNRSKLTVEQVVEAKRLSTLGHNQSEVAKITGISPGNVSNIVNGRSWKGVGE